MQPDACGNVAVVVETERDFFSLLAVVTELGGRLMLGVRRTHNCSDDDGRQTLTNWCRHHVPLISFDFYGSFPLSSAIRIALASVHRIVPCGSSIANGP